jgi:predicted alpha/beta-hydrolase family hydrolase
VEQARAGVDTAALQAVVNARRRAAAASTAAAAEVELQRRRCGVAERERPSPQITKVVSRPASAKYIAALRTTDGGLEEGGRSMPGMMASFFASVSAGHVPDADAMQRVLAAVRTHAVPLDVGKAAVAGVADVSEVEVARVVKQMRPGSTPGPDGLPSELWR